MKIITANIPWIIVGIVRWILKIVKLLLFVSALPFVTRAPVIDWLHLCPVSEVSLDGGSDGQWRYYFNSWRQLSANWRPLHLSPVSTSSQMSSEMLGAGSRHSQLCLMRVTSDHTGSVTAHWLHKHSPNEHMMVTRSDQARAPCQM